MAEITLDADFEPDFDVIVVGGGCAGCVAAYTLAEAGKAVLVVERGNYSGAKNMTGGRIYTHSLAQVFPDYLDAPLQRQGCSRAHFAHGSRFELHGRLHFA